MTYLLLGGAVKRTRLAWASHFVGKNDDEEVTG